jgi:hypothetical protein
MLKAFGKRLQKNDGQSLFLKGKSTISTGPFSIAMLAYQRVTAFSSQAILPMTQCFFTHMIQYLLQD